MIRGDNMARMPYTNFHELNQDWIIKQIKTAYTADNPPPYPVKSVNGQTGIVNINTDNIIDVDSGTDLTDALRAKQDRPAQIGTAGQVLGLDNQLNPVWLNNSGGGGTSDYDDLTDKPQINSVTLSGNKSGDDLGIMDAPSTSGTNGQVLTADGQGNYGWANLPATPSPAVSIVRPVSGNTFILDPCPVTYSFGEKAELTVTVTANSEYHFSFSCPSGTPTVLTITGATETAGDVILEAGEYYEVNVWDGLALYKKIEVTGG